MTEDQRPPTPEELKAMKQMADEGSLTFTYQEIAPILHELVEAKRGFPPARKMRGGKPTNFPDVFATKPDGTPSTLEELMAEMGIRPQIPERIAPPLNTMQLFFNIDLRKPWIIPGFIWKTGKLQNWFKRFLVWYSKITIVNKKNTNDAVIIYDSNILL